jgi:hypothetical protein
MLKETLNAEPPDFPSPPKEGEDSASDNETHHTDDKEFDKLYALYLNMRDTKQGIPTKVRGPITKRVKSFKGMCCSATFSMCNSF